MTETLRQLEDRILVLNAATNPKGQRLALVDHRFKTELFQLRVHLADRQKAELPQGVQISWNQLRGLNPVDHIRGQRNADGSPSKAASDLALLAKAQGAKDPKTGKRYAESPQFAANLQKARIGIFEGQPLSPAMVESTTKLVEQK